MHFCNVYCFYFSLKHLIVHCYLLLFSYCIYHISHMSFVVVTFTKIGSVPHIPFVTLPSPNM